MFATHAILPSLFGILITQTLSVLKVTFFSSYISNKVYVESDLSNNLNPFLILSFNISDSYVTSVLLLDLFSLLLRKLNVGLIFVLEIA